MKPSERIKEITEKIVGDKVHLVTADGLAIIQYLDEQYEKNQTTK